MKLVVAVLVGALLLGGCHKQTPVGSVSQSGISQESYLTFSTSYTVVLSQGRILKVESQSEPWLGFEKISFSDTLTQPNGNVVYFDCRNIADKIIDASLVQEITPLCVSVHQRAEDFWKSLDYAPKEFTDSTGTVWVKKDKK